MAFEIEWTKRADREFDEIIEYLSKEWTYKVKNKFIEILSQIRHDFIIPGDWCFNTQREKDQRNISYRTR